MVRISGTTLSRDVEVIKFATADGAAATVVDDAGGSATVTVNVGTVGTLGGSASFYGNTAAVQQNIGATPDAANIVAALVSAGILTNCTCASTGTAISGGVLESQIVTGGETIILTLTGGSFAAATPFAAARQAIIDGLVAAEVEAAGWNATVHAAMVVANVVRTSASVCTITLPAVAGYVITADENVTITIPVAALSGVYEPVVAATNVVVTANS